MNIVNGTRLQNSIIPLRLPVSGKPVNDPEVLQIRRWVYRTEDGKRTFCVYERTALLALELLESANLGVVLNPNGLKLESEKEAREWEEGVCKSIEYGTRKGTFHGNRGGDK